MKEIVLDCETTGLSVWEDRLVELACVEIDNLIPTGRIFHRYINPRKEVHPGALRVHGLTNRFLSGHKPFERVVGEFLDFIGDHPIVAHNGTKFDVPVINEELKRCKRPVLENPLVDTLHLAREVKKTGAMNLDALCSHFGIDNSRRTKHGALLDAEILAEVYLQMRGGRQFGMGLQGGSSMAIPFASDAPARQRPEPIPYRITQEEIDGHLAFVKGLGEKPVWSEYIEV